MSASLPPAVVADPTILPSQLGTLTKPTNSVAPQIAYNPLNPQEMVEVHSGFATTTNNRAFWTYNYSLDGGASWSAGLISISDLDPTLTGANSSFAQITDATVAFDRANQFYVVVSEHNAAYTSGEFVLHKFDFSLGIPTPVSYALTPNVRNTPNGDGGVIVYQWATEEPGYHPIVAIDNNVPDYQDPATHQHQIDPLAGLNRVYVAFNMAEALYSGTGLPPAGTKDSRIFMMMSDDGGATFSAPTAVSPQQTFVNQEVGSFSSRPVVVFTQGSADGTVAGGQMIVFYENDLHDSQVTPADTYSINYDSSLPGADVNKTFEQNAFPFLNPLTGLPYIDPLTGLPYVDPITGLPLTTPDLPIAEALSGGNNPDVPRTTTTSMDVEMTPAQWAGVTDLNVSLSILHPHDNQLFIQIYAPNGLGGTDPIPFTLFYNGVGSDGKAIKNQGLPDGANLGVVTAGSGNSQKTTVLRTTFDDDALRSINDGAAGAPFIGQYEPETFGLDAFVLAHPFNGNWILSITDVLNDGGKTPPRQELLDWSLNFTGGVSTTGFGTDTVIWSGDPISGGVPGGSVNSVYPNATSAGAAGDFGQTGFGAGLSAAVDNTLGSFSPHQSNVYLAFTWMPDTLARQPLNPDIYVDTFSAATPGLLALITDIKVNDDAAADNFSEGNRAQFAPTLGVDQTTGTVAVSYFDSRTDPSQRRFANSLQTSIDGGTTWSKSVFLNAMKTATDALTGTIYDLEPIPGNLPNASILGFGDRQGMVVYGGKVVAVFSTNYNSTNSLVVASNATIAAGPRIVKGDMGPITAPFIDPATGTSYNVTFSADGTRELDGFVITFDRPVDTATFTAGDVILKYIDPYTGAVTDLSSQILQVVPLDVSQSHGNGDAGTPPTLSISDASVLEGDSGQKSAAFTLVLSQPLSTPLTVTYQTANQAGTGIGEATSSNFANGDYQYTSSTVTFAPGQTSATISIPVYGDVVAEGNETFAVAITAPIAVNKATGIATIIDNETVPTATFGDVTVVKGTSGSQIVKVPVFLSTAVATPVQINWQTADGTATIADSDYAFGGGTLTFTPGQTYGEITVTVNGDRNFEGNEYFLVQSVGISGAALFRGSATVTIVDPNALTVSLGDVTVPDSSATATITAYLNSKTSKPVTVNYDYVSPVDGTLKTGNFTIPSASLSTTFTVPITDVVGNQTFTISLTNATNANYLTNGVPSHATVTIIDSNVLPKLTVGNAIARERDGIIQIPVVLSFASNVPVSVNYSTQDVSATGTALFTSPNSDYIAVPLGSATLTFAPGETTKFIPISITNLPETAKETNETFNLVLDPTSLSNATIEQGTGVATIVDDDVVVTAGNISLTDGTTGGLPTANFTIRLSGPSEHTITVKYATADGTDPLNTAVAGTDYSSTSGTATFTPGVTSITVNVPLLAGIRTTNLGTKSIILQLSNLVDTTAPAAPDVIMNFNNIDTLDANKNKARATIFDVNGTTGFQLSVGDATAAEGTGAAAGSVNFVVALNRAAPAGGISFRYELFNGTALAGQQYVRPAGATSPNFTTVTIAAGATSTTIQVNFIGNSTYNVDKTFSIQIFPPTSNPNGVTVPKSTATAWIRDDDSDSLNIGDAIVSDWDIEQGNANTVTLPILLANATDVTGNQGVGALTGTFSTANGITPPAAVGGVDFTIAGPGSNAYSISNTDNSTHDSASAVIPVFDDPTDTVHNKTFTASLSNLPNSVNISLGTALTPALGKKTGTVTVVNNNLSLSAGDASALESDAYMRFKVYLSHASNSPISFDFNLNTGSASSLDFDALNTLYSANVVYFDPTTNIGIATIAAGATSVEIDVPLIDNTIIQSNRAFSIHLSTHLATNVPDDPDTVPNTVTSAAIARADGTGTIMDDDLTPTVTISPSATFYTGSPIPTPSVLPTVQQFTAYVNYAPETDITFDVSTVSGTAVDTTTDPTNGDFSRKTLQQFKILAGSTSTSIPITLHNDAVRAGNRSFDVSISNLSSNATAGNLTATGTLVDNKQVPFLAVGDATVKEGDSGFVDVAIPVYLTQASTRDVDVSFTLVDGTATSVNGYVAQTGTLHFLAVNTQADPANLVQMIHVQVRSNSLKELDKYFSVKLFSAVNANFSKDTGNVNIVDDDGVYGATVFLVKVTPQAKVGTYSYEVGPNIGDRIETPTSSGNLMDENQNAVRGETGNGGDAFNIPLPVNGVPFQAPYNTDTLPLVIPGPHLISTSAPTMVDSTTSYVDVTFDRDMSASTFTAADILQMTSPYGNIISGPFTVQVNPTGTPATLALRTFRISFPTQYLYGAYSILIGSDIQSVAGDAVDNNQNAGLDVLRGAASDNSLVTNNSYAASGLTPTTGNPTPGVVAAGATKSFTIAVNDSFVITHDAAHHLQVALSLTYSTTIAHGAIAPIDATLIAPDGITSVRLIFHPVSEAGSADFVGTVLDDDAGTVITANNGTFSGIFKPQESLITALAGLNANGTWTLQIHNLGGGSATLSNFTLSLPRSIPSSGLGEQVADRSTVTFNIVALDPNLSDPNNPGQSLANDNWTNVGPSSAATAGRTAAVAVDPVDPSGNTVYVGGMNGGIWKTTNFLTTDPAGPTYIPVADFGYTDGGNSTSMRVGSITAVARNNDPNQTMVFALTGDEAGPGVGLLRSMDGGKTWHIIDNPNANFSDNSDTPLAISDPLRHPGGIAGFVGTTGYKVIVDPKPLQSGDYVVYMTISGGTVSGVWRSVDTGRTWTRLQIDALDTPYIATDIAPAQGNLDQNGNIKFLYVGIQGQGIYFTDSALNSGTVVLQKTVDANNGMGLIDRLNISGNIPVGISAHIPTATSAPTYGAGRITLATPARTGNALLDANYQGYLYALVDGVGLFMTKDSGYNWTKVQMNIDTREILGSGSTQTNTVIDAPSNSTTEDLFTAANGRALPDNAYSGVLVVDPNNPNIVYFGGDFTVGGIYQQSGSLYRVDVSTMYDVYAAVAYDNSANDGGLVQNQTTGSITVRVPTTATNPGGLPTASPIDGTTLLSQYGQYDETALTLASNYFNLFHNPGDPFDTSSDNTYPYQHVTSFNNQGTHVSWSYFDSFVVGDFVHDIATVRDPITGLTRLIVVTDEGVSTAIDRSGTKQNAGINLAVANTTTESAALERGAGSASSGQTVLVNIGAYAPVTGSRSGNLSVMELTDGAIQPSTLAADLAGAMFYAVDHNSRSLQYTPYNPLNPLLPAQQDQNTLDKSKLSWNSDPSLQYTADLAVDPTGSGIQYSMLDFSGGGQDFFHIDRAGVGPVLGRSAGLLLSSDPNQWTGNLSATVAVNPDDPSGLVIGSYTGRIYRSIDPGATNPNAGTGYGRKWTAIATPAQMGNSAITALAYGAPVANASSTQLDDFIYAGTQAGHVLVTTNGGGIWTDITSNLPAGNGILRLFPSPTRGTAARPSREVYILTSNGIYWTQDSSAPTISWTLLNDTTGRGTLLGATPANLLNPTNAAVSSSLTSLTIDWRYAIPDSLSDTSINRPTHPVLYAATRKGLFRSLDKGVTWTLYPGIPGQGESQGNGNLASVAITDLDLSVGNVNPATGLPNQTSSQNMLYATTEGRGAWFIRLDNSAIQQYLVVPNSGPQVTAITPKFAAAGSQISAIDVTFSGSISPLSITLADIASLTVKDSGNTITDLRPLVAAITDITVPGSDGTNPHNVYEITFTSNLTIKGSYTLALGPNIFDPDGTLMNQDGDNINGEAPTTSVSDPLGLLTPNDMFVTNFTLVDNVAPVVTLGFTTPQPAAPGIASAPLPLSLSDLNALSLHDESAVTMSGTSSDQSIVADSDVTFAGTGANRTVIIKPNLLAVHAQTVNISITATDPDGLPSSKTFAIFIDSTPVLTPSAVSHVTPRASSASFGFTATDADSVDTLTYTHSSVSIVDPTALGINQANGANLNGVSNSQWVINSTTNVQYYLKLVTVDGVQAAELHQWTGTEAGSPLKGLFNVFYYNTPSDLWNNPVPVALGTHVVPTFTPQVAGLSPRTATLSLADDRPFVGSVVYSVTISDGLVPVTKDVYVLFVDPNAPTLVQKTTSTYVTDSAPAAASQTVSHTTGAVDFYIDAKDVDGDFNAGTPSAHVSILGTPTFTPSTNSGAITVTLTPAGATTSEIKEHLVVANAGQYVGTVQVTIQVTDGILTATKVFSVTYTNQAPTLMQKTDNTYATDALAAAATQTVSHTTGVVDFYLDAKDNDGDFSAATPGTNVTILGTPVFSPAANSSAVAGSIVFETGSTTGESKSHLHVTNTGLYTGTVQYTVQVGDGFTAVTKVLTVTYTNQAPTLVQKTDNTYAADALPAAATKSVPHSTSGVDFYLEAKDLDGDFSPSNPGTNFSIVGTPTFTPAANSGAVAGSFIYESGATSGDIKTHFHVTNTGGYLGTAQFTVQASDGFVSVTKVFSVTYTNVPPTLVQKTDSTYAIGALPAASIKTVPHSTAAVDFYFEAKDADNDLNASSPGTNITIVGSPTFTPATNSSAVAGSLIFESGALAGDIKGHLNVTNTGGYLGTVQFTVQVSDGFVTATKVFTVSYTNLASALVQKTDSTYATDALPAAASQTVPHSTAAVDFYLEAKDADNDLSAGTPGTNVTIVGAPVFSSTTNNRAVAGSLIFESGNTSGDIKGHLHVNNTGAYLGTVQFVVQISDGLVTSTKVLTVTYTDQPPTLVQKTDSTYTTDAPAAASTQSASHVNPAVNFFIEAKDTDADFTVPATNLVAAVVSSTGGHVTADIVFDGTAPGDLKARLRVVNDGLFLGSVQVSATATDSAGAAITNYFFVTYTNRTPTIVSSPAMQTVGRSSSANFTLTATDLDNDALSLSVQKITLAFTQTGVVAPATIANAKWVKDTIDNSLYYLRANGTKADLFRWAGNVPNSPLVGTFDISVYNTIALLWTTDITTLGINAITTSIINQSGNKTGTLHVVTDGSFAGPLNITVGAADSGSSVTSSVFLQYSDNAPIVTLSNSANPLSVNGVALSHNNTGIVATTIAVNSSDPGDVVAYSVSTNTINTQALGLVSFTGTLPVAIANTKWLKNASGALYYVSLVGHNGIAAAELHAWGGSAAASPLVGLFDRSYYDTPTKFNSSAATYAGEVTFDVVGNVLKANFHTSFFVGAVRVTIKASDGAMTVSRDVYVLINNSAPVFTPSISTAVAGTTNVRIGSASEADGDLLSWNVNSFNYSQAYELNQLYHFSGQNSTLYNHFGNLEKVLITPTFGVSYVLWPVWSDPATKKQLLSVGLYRYSASGVLGQILAVVDSTYYTNPNLLFNPSAPTAADGITTHVSGNDLYLDNIPLSYKGKKIRIYVTVTDTLGASSLFAVLLTIT